MFLKRKDISPLLDLSLHWDDPSLKSKAREMAKLAVDCIDEDRLERPFFAKIIYILTGVEIKLFNSQVVVDNDDDDDDSMKRE